MNNILRITLWGHDVGRLVWDEKERRAFFSFSPSFLSTGYDIAPLTASIHKPYLRQGGIYKGNIEQRIYKGLPEFLADSLPDRWGESLISRWQRENMPNVAFTPVDALAFMGKRAMGALEFEPCIDQWGAPVDLELGCLYKIADDILNERTVVMDNVNTASMQSLYLVGTSAGGMQPKAIIAINEDDGSVKSGQIPLDGNYKYYILKFDRDGRFPFTLMEKTYYDMALACGIKMMPSRLINIDSRRHFITERFDRTASGKVHIQTLAAISPDADCYEDLMKTARLLRLPDNELEDLFRIAVFNVLAANVDDHNKNFSFLMGREGHWHAAPAYDLNFTVDLHGSQLYHRHEFSMCGKDRNITRDDILRFGENACIKSASSIIDDVEYAIRHFPNFAKDNGIDRRYVDEIGEYLLNRCGLFQS